MKVCKHYSVTAFVTIGDLIDSRTIIWLQSVVTLIILSQVFIVYYGVLRCLFG